VSPRIAWNIIFVLVIVILEGIADCNFMMSLDEIPDDAAIGPVDLDQTLEDPE
jgi:hypothetical protein